MSEDVPRFFWSRKSRALYANRHIESYTMWRESTGAQERYLIGVMPIAAAMALVNHLGGNVCHELETDDTSA